MATRLTESRNELGGGKYRIVLPETKEVPLTVAWGSITEAVAVSDMIGSHSCPPEDNSRSYIVNLYVGSDTSSTLWYQCLNIQWFANTER